MASAKHYTEEELIKLRQIQMNIYREIKRICDNHNIQFVAIGGSAIGAVRHKGYIPWDDDLDIAMMREEYVRFLEYAKNEIGPNYFVQNIGTDKYYGNYFTKIRCNGTLFVQNIDKNDKSHHGIFVDIFPIDRVTDNVTEREKYRKKLMFVFQMYMAKCNSGISGETASMKGKIKHFVRASLHVLLTFASKEKLFTKVDELSQIYNKAKPKTLMISVVFAMTGRCIEDDAVFPPVELPFEEDTMMVPHDIDRYLTHIFGDYMKLPPIEKRVNHRPVQLSFGEETLDF